MAPPAGEDRSHPAGGDWLPVLERSPVQPDTRHRFLVPESAPVTQARLDIYPDGGMARFRLRGTPSP